MCIYIYTYIHIHIHIYIYLFICVNIYTYTYTKLISGWGVIDSHDWNRCSLKEEGYHTIYISNYLILNLSYLWTTSYDRSLLNWTIRAKWKKNKTELFGECLVWTQKMSLFVLFCSCCVSLWVLKWKKQNNLEFFCMNTVSQYLKNKKLNVFFLVFETLQVKKANLKWRKTKTVFSFCFLRYWLITDNIYSKKQNTLNEVLYFFRLQNPNKQKTQGTHKRKHVLSPNQIFSQRVCCFFSFWLCSSFGALHQTGWKILPMWLTTVKNYGNNLVVWHIFLKLLVKCLNRESKSLDSIRVLILKLEVGAETI